MYLRFHSGDRGCSAFPLPPSATSASSLGGLRGGSLRGDVCCSGGGEDNLGGVDGDDVEDEVEI